MGYLKKFTDLGAGIAAAYGAVYLLREFMTFKPKDVESSSEKLKLFFSNEAKLDYRSLLILVALLALSALVGILLRRIPYVTLPVALAAFGFTMYLFSEKKLYERPMLFVLLAGMQVIGNYVDALARDRRDGKGRTRILGDLTQLGVILFCVFILWRKHSIAEIPPAELGPFDADLYLAGRLEEPFSILIVISVMCAVCVLIRILLRELYFIDAALSLIPLGYTLYHLGAETLSVGLPVLLALLLTASAVRIALMLAPPSDREVFEKNQEEAGDASTFLSQKGGAKEPKTS